MILKAAIPVRAARKTGLPFPTIIVISCIFVYTFRNINIFPVPVSLLIFRNSYKEGISSWINLVNIINNNSIKKFFLFYI
jgi:hypothetical protein